MTGRNGKPSREDAVYEVVAASVRRYGFAIALVAPFLLISLVPMGEAGVLLVVLIYLGEAIVYAALRSKRMGRGAGPGPALQALWVILAVLLILGGLFALSGTGSPAATVGIAIGVLIVVWVWARVARASGESTLAFFARIGRQIVETIKRAIVSDGP